MNRREQRELVFLLIFENSFTSCSLEEIKANKIFVEELSEKEFNKFIEMYFNGILDNLTTIDQLIEKHSLNWGKNRLSKVALAILRLAVYEILFREDIPVGVSINEAVELSKKYGTQKESSFINGILGGISRDLESTNV